MKKELIEVYRTIRQFRELRKLTREDMAAELELSISAYGKLERGETELSLSKLYRIAEVFETDIANILNFKPSMVFNINNNQMVQASKESFSKTSSQVLQNNEYLEKYVKILEAEVEKLKSKPA
jgi:transcriptional regulator with XRE-family HTH domain